MQHNRDTFAFMGSEGSQDSDDKKAEQMDSKKMDQKSGTVSWREFQPQEQIRESSLNKQSPDKDMTLAKKVKTETK